MMTLDNKKNKVPFYQTWMTVVYDKNLNIVDIFNPQHCMMLQLSSDVLLGMNIYDLEEITEGPNKEPARIITRNIRKAFKEGRNVYFEYSTTHQDGSVTYALCYAEKGPDELLYVNVIKIDEENIFEARDGFTNYVINTTMNNISVGVYMRYINVDGTKKYILFNDVAKEFYEAEDIQQSKHWNQADEDLADEKTLKLSDPLKIEKVFRDEQGYIKGWFVVTKKKINSRAKGFYVITTIINITQRRQNEILLEQQFALLDSMYEHLPVGIIIYDKEGKMVSINRKTMVMFGIKDKEKAFGKNIFDEPNTPNEVKKRIKAGEDVEYEVEYDFAHFSRKYDHRTHHGKCILSVKSAIIRNKKREIDGYLQICEDITEKKRTEQTLWQKHQLIESIYNAIPIGIERYDKEGCLVETNNYNMQMMGIKDKESIIGVSLFDDPNISNDIKKKTRNGENVEYTLEYDFDLSHKNYYNTNISGKKYLNIKTTVLRDRENNVDGYLFVAQDQTQKIKRERLLEETATKFSAMFNSMSNGIEIYDKNGILEDCNEADLNIFGIANKSDLLNSRISIYDNPNVPYESLHRLLQGESLSFNVCYNFDVVKKQNYYPTTKSGLMTIEVKFAPIYVNKDEFIGYVAEVNDVTAAIEKDIKLKNTQRDLTLAMDAGNIAAWNFDVKTQIFSTLYGNALAGKSLTFDDNLKMMHPEDAKQLPSILNSIIHGEKDKNIAVLRYKSNDIYGGYRYYESSMIGVKKDDKVQFVIGTQKEITNDIIIKKQLEEAHQKSSLIVDNLISGIVYLDNNYTVIWENLKALQDHPRGNGYKVGKKCYETAFGRTTPCEHCVINEVKACGKRTTITEFEATGEILNITADIVKDKDNKEIGYICRLDDVTKSYNHKIELERSREDLNLALEAGNISAWTYDVKSKIFNTLQGDILINDGISIADNQKILHPDDRQMQIDLFDSIARGEQSYASTTFRYMQPDGTYHHFECKMIAKLQNDKVTAITGTQKDITEQIEYQKQLMILKEKALSTNQILNQILDNIPSMLSVKNSNDDYRFVLVNKGFCNYVGRSYNKVVNHKDTELFDTKNTNKFSYYDKLVVETGETYSYDDCITINGVSTYWHIIKSPLKMANGNIYTVSIATDITSTMEYNAKLKAAQKEAVLTNEILNEIIDRVPGGLYFKDTSDDFRYTKANKAFCEIAGKSQSEIVGHTDFEIFNHESAHKFREYDLKLKGGETTVSYSNVSIVKGCQEYWQINKSIITTQDNNSIILGVATNVTKYHKINQELEQAKVKAEQSDKLKSAFLANMSHEIRTPLNAIVGFSELLHITDDEQEKSEYINIINRNNDLLLRLINDILDLSKIESGLIELKPEKFDISTTFCETFVALKARCSNPDVKFLGVNPYNKCIINLDKNRLLQVWTNFVTNAIKYTAKGQIVMGYEQYDEGLYLYVTDTGIGIPKEKQFLLFQRFAKLDDFAQGTGLGLAICKAIVDAKGGKIGFESEEGKGSTFWAKIPCEVVIDNRETNIPNNCTTQINKNTQNTQNIQNIQNIQEKKTSILVAEDNDSNYMLIQAILKKYVLTRAVNGVLAVDLVSKNKFDVILMDMKMPIMGGLEATRMIREFDKTTPIIALTANVFDSDKVDALKAGCNAFIAKPLKKKELEELLEATGGKFIDAN